MVEIQRVSNEIFTKKYCLHGEKSKNEVFIKVAEEISRKEKNKDKYKSIYFILMQLGQLFPGGRILSNARINSKLKNYNNCFTIGIEDSIEEIYTSLKEDALISKQGGGVGFDCSKLRPKNSPLSRGGASSGVISFLKIFNESAKKVSTYCLVRY